MLKNARRQKERRRVLKRRMESLAARLDGVEHDRLDDLLANTDDGWEPIRQKIVELAGERGEWAGYPMPVHGSRLQIERRHPLFSRLHGATLDDDPNPAERMADAVVAASRGFLVNSWVDHRGWRVFVYRTAQGRARAYVAPKNPETARFAMTLDTLQASNGWSVEAEFTALARLKTLINRTAFRYYVLTGTFLETSPRSRVHYLFRKGRPTIAIGSAGHGSDDTKVLCALCLHPIGFYGGTFAGSMVPTDDVIAHLLMMRGDERRFWAKCNQHEPWMPEAGI